MSEFPLNLGIMSDGEDSLQSWPFPISDEQYLFRIMVRGDPVPASRPRVLKTGHTYYHKRYGNYRDALSWYLAGSLRPVPDAAFIDPDIPADRRRYGIRAIFYRKSRQRCDVDNLLKTIFDAGTGIVWPDDSSIDEVFAKIIRPSSEPRVELLVYETASQPDNRTCKQCGKSFYGFPCTTRPFCSLECYKTAQESRRVHLKCKMCGGDFSVLKCVLKQRSVGFCSQTCSLKHLSQSRKMNGSAQWTCKDCGAQVSRKEYKRCGLCERVRRGRRVVEQELNKEKENSLPF